MRPNGRVPTERSPVAALVVVESMWGNTRAVGEAVARGLGPEARVVEVGEAPPEVPDDVGLVVVGGPTHAFSMSRRSTRHDALDRGAPGGAESRGIREWLAELSPEQELDLATFDTRVGRARLLPGSAARAAARVARRHHLGRSVGSASFYVEDVEGPLLDGELARAEAWGSRLAGARP